MRSQISRVAGTGMCSGRGVGSMSMRQGNGKHFRPETWGLDSSPNLTIDICGRRGRMGAIPPRRPIRAEQFCHARRGPSRLGGRAFRTARRQTKPMMHVRAKRSHPPDRPTNEPTGSATRLSLRRSRSHWRPRPTNEPTAAWATCRARRIRAADERTHGRLGKLPALHRRGRRTNPPRASSLWCGKILHCRGLACSDG